MKESLKVRLPYAREIVKQKGNSFYALQQHLGLGFYDAAELLKVIMEENKNAEVNDGR